MPAKDINQSERCGSGLEYRSEKSRENREYHLRREIVEKARESQEENILGQAQDAR